MAFRNFIESIMDICISQAKNELKQSEFVTNYMNLFQKDLCTETIIQTLLWNRISAAAVRIFAEELSASALLYCTFKDCH